MTEAAEMRWRATECSEEIMAPSLGDRQNCAGVLSEIYLVCDALTKTTVDICCQYAFFNKVR